MYDHIIQNNLHLSCGQTVGWCPFPAEHSINRDSDNEGWFVSGDSINIAGEGSTGFTNKNFG